MTGASIGLFREGADLGVAALALRISSRLSVAAATGVSAAAMLALQVALLG
jgi:hypothetical protein